MTKGQAIQNFWSAFGLTAYDEHTVPDDAQMPYITYGVSTGALGDVVLLYGNLWYYSTSWKDISEKAEEIAQAIGYGYQISTLDNGYVWITRGSPFAQRMADDTDDKIRRIYINLNAEFLTPY